MSIFRPLTMVQGLLKNHLSVGSYVIDATVGNGHDSVFIAEQLNHSGKLFGFDIQPTAIHATQSKLAALKPACAYQLFQTGHEQLYNTLQIHEGKIDCILFNLGFLPNYNQAITTLPQTTYSALLQGIRLLRYKGIVLLVAYPGHVAGALEQQFLEKLLTAAPPQFYCTVYKQLNKTKKAPIVYTIEKK